MYLEVKLQQTNVLRGLMQLVDYGFEDKQQLAA